MHILEKRQAGEFGQAQSSSFGPGSDHTWANARTGRMPQ